MAADSDRVVHLTFKHEWMRIGDFEGSANADRHAVEALGETLAGSDRPLVTASGRPGSRLDELRPKRTGTASLRARFHPVPAFDGHGRVQ